MYVVSNLRRSGPTNQLLNVIKHLDRQQYEVVVLTLSPEGEDSRLLDFEEFGVKVVSLNLSRIRGLFFSKYHLKKRITLLNPDIIHSQGIRPDSLLARLRGRFSWVLTSHNYPAVDYPLKYGRLLGGIMAVIHFFVMRKCPNVVSCSRTIATQIDPHGISSLPIQNGTDELTLSVLPLKQVKELTGTVFVTVGSLIERKNVMELVRAFNECEKSSANTLLILGDGPLMEELKLESGGNIIYTGNISNVADYLDLADFYVSASVSEGLPMTVIEALCAGLPAILSDIPSHREVYDDCKTAVVLFELGSDELEVKLKTVKEIFGAKASLDAKKVAKTIFSSTRMSKDYQGLYKMLVLESNN